jgi:hypothetical protein
MKDKPPEGPGWSDAPGSGDPARPNSIAHKDEIERVKKLRAELPDLLKDLNEKHRGRVQKFYPYLLVRSVVGDRGDRPLNVPFWESPDIWTAPGDPSVSPPIPPDHGGTLTANQPHTIYAHVWNLGRAPIVGVKLEFYWFDPTLAIDLAHANLIGMTRVDLGPRNSLGCHRLVKCPKAWVPQLVNGGHECLVVRASCVGDNISTSHPWDAWADRHVAQRNVHVAAASDEISKLIRSLEATKPRGGRIQLVQVGEHADLTLKIAAPRLKLDPKVKTHVLAELRPDGSVHTPPTVTGTVGGQAPARTPAKESQTTGGDPFSVARIVPSELLAIGKPSKQARTVAGVKTDLAAEDTDLMHLFNHHTLFSTERARRMKKVSPPTHEQAQVLRVICFKGDQMTGGYTIIVKGK